MSIYNRPTDATSTSSRMAWTHWVNGIAGIVLFFGPWLFQYHFNTVAMWTSLILGFLIALFAFWALLARHIGGWSQWAVLVLGVLTFIAPWVLGFAGQVSAFWTCIIIGAISVVVAAIGIFMRPTAGVA
jgi:hypothetical protein